MNTKHQLPRRGVCAALLLMTLYATTTACGPTDEATELPPEMTAGEDPLRCVAPEGMGSPTTIAEAVDLLNALPGDPVTLPCFLESLDRPVSLFATESTLSAQPAVGPDNPRIFVFTGDGALIMSVVPAGVGRELLEFGEQVSARDSVKGELVMPVAQPVSHGAPYGHIRYNDQVTSCGLCHRHELRFDAIAYKDAFVSLAFRPTGNKHIPLERLRELDASCDVEEDPERCAIFDAIFDHGEVLHREFPQDMATFFEL